MYEETTEEFKESWFKKTRDKFLYHIDTFYYTVEIEGNAMKWHMKNRLLTYLRMAKDGAERSFEPSTIFMDDDQLYKYGFIVNPHMSFGFYKYHIGIKDAFDIFICEHSPNDATPVMVVQLRSAYLWLEGTQRAFEKSLEAVLDLMAFSKHRIKKIQENRIDYAFHTNYIQNPLKFFPVDDLGRMQVSNFSRWHQEGKLYEDEVDCDYFTLGRRASNNIFFRVYDKTQEVIQKNYKPFFFWIWLYNGMISHYDAYCYEKMYVKRSMTHQYVARLEFYQEHGQDDAVKFEISGLLEQMTNMAGIEKLAKKLTPELTKVVNIEFQTKRKYYSYFKELPNPRNRSGVAQSIQQLIDVQELITDTLTENSLRFIKYKGVELDANRSRRETADWWLRLRRSVSQSLEYQVEKDKELIREYHHKLDIEKQKHLTLSKIASLSVYKESKEELNYDLLDFITNLNDNDIEKYYRMKNRKEKVIRPYLDKDKPVNEKEQHKYALLNRESGEIIEYVTQNPLSESADQPAADK